MAKSQKKGSIAYDGINDSNCNN